MCSLMLDLVDSLSGYENECVVDWFKLQIVLLAISCNGDFIVLLFSSCFLLASACIVIYLCSNALQYPQ